MRAGCRRWCPRGGCGAPVNGQKSPHSKTRLVGNQRHMAVANAAGECNSPRAPHLYFLNEDGAPKGKLWGGNAQGLRALGRRQYGLLLHARHHEAKGWQATRAFQRRRPNTTTLCQGCHGSQGVPTKDTKHRRMGGGEQCVAGGRDTRGAPRSKAAGAFAPPFFFFVTARKRSEQGTKW